HVERGSEEVTDLHRIRHPSRVSEADLLAAGVHQLPRDCKHAMHGHMPLVRAAERGGDHALAAQSLLTRASKGAPQPRERLRDRLSDVLAVVGLRSRQEAVDLLKA